MKITKLNPETAQKEFDAIPERKVGQWTELCKSVLDTGKPVEVTGITQGQSAALRRQATKDGLRAKSTNKGTKVIILPAESKK